MPIHSSHKNWCVTLNNPAIVIEGFPPSVYNHIEAAKCVFQVPDVQYSVFQIERGATGTVHAQAYVQFKASVTLVQARVILDPRCHLEVRKGTHAQARDYCTKAGTRCEGSEPQHYGVERDNQGNRTDLDAIKAFIDAGATELEVWNEHFASSVRHHKAFTVYRSLRTPQRSQHTFATVLWGPSGSGKSLRAFTDGGPNAFWVAKPNSSRAFWDGYSGQEVVVIDEFYGWLPYTFVLRLLDRYPFRVETKGGSVPFTSTRVIFTSNTCPVTWYKKGLQSMRRRLLEHGEVFYLDVGKEAEIYILPDDPEIALYGERAHHDPFQ